MRLAVIFIFILSGCSSADKKNCDRLLTEIETDNVLTQMDKCRSYAGRICEDNNTQMECLMAVEKICSEFANAYLFSRSVEAEYSGCKN